ncbi:MAG: hypothetical protein AAFP18_17820 [Bacteroidota bacterium]
MDKLLEGLKAQTWPTPVAGWKVERGLDATDDEAVWVWATLENDGVAYATIAEMREQIRSLAMEVVPSVAWAYVRFRTASEVGNVHEVEV